METNLIEVSEKVVKKKSPPPPRIESLGVSKPRRRRIRSELDRLLSDEGTRNMLRGLKKPGGKKPSNVFRTRVDVVGGRGGRSGIRGLVGRKLVAVRRRSSTVTKQPARGRSASATRRSASPGKGREFKIDANCVNVSVRGGVGWVTIVGGGEVKREDGDGGTYNRVSGGWGVKVISSVECAVRSLEGDDSVSVILVQNSHSRYFCNGVDLSELVGGAGISRISSVVKAMKSLIQTLNSCRKVLVASISGDCVGFGVMVLPLFDLVYANDKSSFRVHYNALGQSPEGVAILGALLRGGGAGKITSLIYLNKSLTATEALQAGLVHEILWPAKYQEELAVRLQSLSNQGDLVCSSKSLVRVYRRSVKVTDLNSEFSSIEEQWGSKAFQDVAKGIVVAGDYDTWLWGESSRANGVN